MIKISKLAKGTAETKFDYIPFDSGVDLVTPSNMTRPGSLRECLNYEANINGGYTMIQGYERFDGQPSPSDALYYRIDVNITGSIEAGDIVVDATTAATATVIEVNTEYDESQAFLVVTKLSGGNFGIGNTINVSGSPEGTAEGDGDPGDTANIAGGAPSSQLDAQYKNLAADEYRSDISAVPGEGKVLGVWLFNDVVYAFRNNVGSTQAVMHKSTASGWAAVTMPEVMDFTSGGVVEISIGDTITGKTSGATAVVTGIGLTDGLWSAGTAEGKIYFASKTGNFTPAENISISGGAGSDDATVTADSVTLTLLPGGRYEFETNNFGGLANSEKMWGVDGVNYGFSFDGTNFVQIPTTMAVDQPAHIAIFKNHLFYSFGGSVQHSGPNSPYEWSPIIGAAELAVGNTITGLEVQPGGLGGAESANAALAVISRNRIHMLYGTSSADWQLVQYRKEVGAFPHSIQEFGVTMMMDDRGITLLETAQEFGNFSHSVVSKLVQPFVTARKTRVNASCIARDKSQYRIFFSDSYALYITTDNSKIMGIMVEKYNHTVECVCSLEASDGSEEMYFGDGDGFVYQMDRGTSFDGDAIERVFATHFHHSKSPRIEKTYFDASFEVSGAGYSEFSLRYELGYNSADIPQPASRELSVSFSSAVWDSFVWDNFIWDGVVLQPSNIGLDGSAENISLIFTSNSDYFEPMTFSGAQIRQTFRKQLRS